MNVASLGGGKYKVTHLLSYKCAFFPLKNISGTGGTVKK